MESRSRPRHQVQGLYSQQTLSIARHWEHNWKDSNLANGGPLIRRCACQGPTSYWEPRLPEQAAASDKPTAFLIISLAPVRDKPPSSESFITRVPNLSLFFTPEAIQNDLLQEIPRSDQTVEAPQPFFAPVL